MTKFSEYQASLSSDAFFCFGCYKKTATTAPLYDFLTLGLGGDLYDYAGRICFLSRWAGHGKAFLDWETQMGFFNVRGDLSQSFIHASLVGILR